MGRFSKGTITAWVFAVLFFISSISLLIDGKIGPFFTGLVISIGLAFLGWRIYVKQWIWREKQDINTNQSESYVYIGGSGSGRKFHHDSKCGGLRDPKYISTSQAKRQGYTACRKCVKYRYL